MKLHQKPTKTIIKIDLTKDQGFVKLQRSILRSPIFADANLFRVYLWCLLKANHTQKSFSIKTGKGSTLVECKRGTFITGRNKASDDLGISGSTFRSYLTRIQKIGLLKLMPTAHYTIVEVVNYDTQKTTNHSTNRQPLVTTKNDNKEKKQKKNEINKYKYYFKTIDKLKYSKQILQDYASVAKQIHGQWKNVRNVPGIFSIDDFAEVRRSYSMDNIVETLEAMNGYESIKKCLVVKAMLISWLKRNTHLDVVKNPQQIQKHRAIVARLKEIVASGGEGLDF